MLAWLDKSIHKHPLIWLSLAYPYASPLLFGVWIVSRNNKEIRDNLTWN